MLSDHFSLAEMTKSQTAERRNLPNNPDKDAIEAMKLLCINILEPVRNHFDKPFTPSSGFRSAELCVAMGSSVSSQHTKGEAADFEVPGVSNLDLATWIVGNLDFDQLILEFYKGGNTGWVHCSFKQEGNRRDVLTYQGKESGYQKGLIP
jgi:hypothetical protein